MNIIIPQDEKVNYFVMDLRDSLRGEMMQDNTHTNSIAELVVVANKKYLMLDENGEISIKGLSKFYNDSFKGLNEKNKPFLRQRFYNFYASIIEGVNYHIMPKTIKKAKAGVPLGKSNMQYVTIEIKNPKFEEMGDEAYIDVYQTYIEHELEHVKMPDKDNSKKEETVKEICKKNKRTNMDNNPLVEQYMRYLREKEEQEKMEKEKQKGKKKTKRPTIEDNGMVR